MMKTSHDCIPVHVWHLASWQPSSLLLQDSGTHLARIAARDIYRDPVRSSRSHFVKVSGLRWLCMMLLAPAPWAARVWALAFLTALCRSQRYHDSQGRRHKTLTD